MSQLIPRAPLEDGEVEISPSDQKLWRQVNPRWFDNDVIGELAFRASGEEDYKLSVSQESKVTAQSAYKFHTEQMARHSAGVAAVTANEVSEVGCRTVDDETIQEIDPPTPGHAYVDKRGLNKKQRKEIREELADFATVRGLAYRP